VLIKPCSISFGWVSLWGYAQTFHRMQLVCTRRGESQGRHIVAKFRIYEFSQPLIQYFCRQTIDRSFHCTWSIDPWWTICRTLSDHLQPMMLSTPATVEGFTKLCDCLGSEISIIRTKVVPDQIVPAFLTRVFSLILELQRIKSYLKRRNYDELATPMEPMTLVHP